MIDGVILIDKSAGPTAHDLVNDLRRIFKQKRVGHAGTLDPAATGLMVMMLGRATRLSRWLTAADKVYSGAIRFGIETDTYDAAGRVLSKHPCRLSNAGITAAVQHFLGEIDQKPPAFSAIKQGGRPVYRDARLGIEVRIPSRKVSVGYFRAEIIEAGEYPLAEFEVACSSGTYVRSLAADLGREIGCGAHLEKLRRLRSGCFRVEDAVTVEKLKALRESEREALIVDPARALGLPEILVSPEEAAALADGIAMALKKSPAEIDKGSLWVKIISTADRNLIAVGELVRRADPDEVLLKPRVVLVREDGS